MKPRTPPAPSAPIPRATPLEIWSSPLVRSRWTRHGHYPEGISAQAEQSCKNVGAILEAGGSGFEQVFKTLCFLADMKDFAAFNEVYAKYFTSNPARSCVAVKELPKGVLCEIEAIALKK